MKLAQLRAAVDREGPSPGARAVWWAIAAHADSDGYAWPKLDVIARMAGMSERSARDNLRDLEHHGMIETSRLPNRRNRYYIVTSAEAQFRFPTGGTPPNQSGGTPPDMRRHTSGRTGNGQLSDQPKRPLEVHNEVHKEVAPTFLNGSGWITPPQPATPISKEQQAANLAAIRAARTTVTRARQRPENE